MTFTQLRTPILEDGLQSINFFNGRLLSAKDLSQEQAANREVHDRLGCVIGAGIARGLEVSQSTDPGQSGEAVVRVESGLAVNRAGQTLWLKERTEVSLLRASSANGSGSAKTFFGDCEPAQAGVYLAGAGMYLLTLAPAEGRGSPALVGGLGNTGAACDTRDRVAGVQFNAIQLPVPVNVLADVNRLRNRVAYLCFGAAEVQALHTNPFGPPLEAYGLLDDLRPTELTDCEVPLAVIHWTAAGIRFVDMWSVRRRPVNPAPLAEVPTAARSWSALISERRLSESEAMFLQFQDHLQIIRAKEAHPETIAAQDRFAYLPPVGLLPLLAPGPSAGRGFEAQTFFRDLTVRDPTADPVYLEGAALNALIREALTYPPIDLNNDLTKKELIWLYRIRENQQTRDAGGAGLPGAYLVFTNGHVPYRGDARFDLNYWGYSNHA